MPALSAQAPTGAHYHPGISISSPQMLYLIYRGQASPDLTWIPVTKSLQIINHCRSSMQIRRYVYKDVVRVQDIHDHIDTTGIQTYINNSAKVVFLRERPHNNINKVQIP